MRFREGRLGYVFADLLWIMIQRGPDDPLTSEVGDLILAVDKEIFPCQDQVYERILPRLGPSIIPHLVGRLVSAEGDNRTPYAKMISRGLLAIGKEDKTAVTFAALGMLENELPHVREGGLHILSQLPDRTGLDRVWQLHQQNKGESLRYFRYKLSLKALVACVREGSGWLETRIRNCDPSSEPLAELLYVLASLKGGKKIWNSVKEKVINMMSTGDRHAVIRCILEHMDLDEGARLEEWVIDNDIINMDAFCALCAVAPGKALLKISSIPPKHLTPYHRMWLPKLYFRQPDETAVHLRALMAEAGEGFWNVAHCFDGYEDLVDPGITKLMLDTLEQQFDFYTIDGATPSADILWRNLQLLNGIWSPHCLDVFTSKAGSNLEEKLVRAACSWIQEKEGGTLVSLAVEATQGILLKMQAVGMTKLVNCLIGTSDDEAHWIGLDYAYVAADEATFLRLGELARSDKISPSVSKRAYPLAQMKALEVLAEHGQWDIVVDTILKWDHNVISMKLAEIFEEMSPLPFHCIHDAEELLSSPDTTQRLRAVIAIGLIGRGESKSSIWEIYRSEPHDSELAAASFTALSRIGGCDSKLVEAAALQLEISEHRRIVILALGRIDKPEALDVVESALLKYGQEGFGDMYWGLAASLCREDARRERLLPKLCNDVARGNDILHLMTAFSALGHSLDPMTDDYLWKQAFAPDEGIHFVGRQVAAMRALSRRDPDAAFKAAETMLGESEAKDRELLPELLLDIDSRRGTNLLCLRFPEEENIAVRTAIVRSLRLSGDESSISIYIDRWLVAEAFSERRAGIELCGAMGVGWKEEGLRSICENEIDRELREMAFSSLREQMRERNAKTLLSRIDLAQSAIEKWGLVEAVLNVADVEILRDQRDPLGFLEAYSRWPASLRWHAKQIAKKKIDDAQKLVKDEDRKRQEA